MPYIKQERREALRTDFDGPQNAGELNYLITKVFIGAADEDEAYTKVRYIINAYVLIHELSYQRINDVMGALVGAVREYERRIGSLKYSHAMSRLMDHFYYSVAAPYENKKIDENGDVYE